MSYDSEVLADSPQAYWKFEEASGLLAVDAAHTSTSTVDTFTRSDSSSSPGGSWSVLRGTWGISSNKAYNAGNTSDAVAVLDAGVSDYMVAVDVASIASGTYIGVRVQDADNGYFIGIHSGAYGIYKRVSGTFTQIAGLGTNGSGHWVVVVKGTNIFVWKDGTVLGNVSDSTFTTGTKVGLRTDSNGPLFDNFAIATGKDALYYLPSAYQATGPRTSLSYGVTLDGSSSYIQLPPDAVAVGTGGAFTYEIWAKVTSGNQWQRFLDAGNGSGSDNLIFTPTTNNSTLSFQRYADSTIGKGPWPDTTDWHHAAVTVDASKNVTVYFDGAPWVTAVTSNAPSIVNRLLNYIGKSNWNDPYLQGTIGRAAFYPTALSGERIARHYVAARETFAPTDETGLKIWVRPEELASSADGDPVGTWADHSGNSNDLTATGTQRPTYHTAGGPRSTGSSRVTFDGSDDQLAIPNVLSAMTAGEIFAVLKSGFSSSTDNKSLWKIGTDSDADGTKYEHTDTQIYDGFGSTTLHNHSSSGGSQLDITKWRTYNVSSKASEFVQRHDGLILGTDTSNTVGFRTTPIIGHFGSSNWTGDIAELLIYDHVLTSAQRQKVNDYLRERWAAEVVITASIGQASETETAQPVTITRQYSLGIPTETETAQPLSLVFQGHMPIDPATETETAQPIILARIMDIGQAVETETGQSLALSKSMPIGTATEADTAPALNLIKEHDMNLGIATETETAPAVDAFLAVHGDYFIDPIVLGTDSGSLTVDDTGMTSETDEPDRTSGADPTSPTVWFKYTPSVSGIASFQATPAVSVGTGDTVFGTTLLNGGGGLTAVETKYGESIPALRLFGGTDTPGTGACQAISGVLSSIDTKYDASTDPATVTSWAAGLPDGTRVSYWHEPEDEIKKGVFTAATFISKFRAFYTAVKAGNPNVIVELSLMAYTLDPHSGRDWNNYYPGSAYVDCIAWDFDGVAPSGSAYPDFSVQLGKAVAISTSTGKPWSVTEFTAAQAGWDPSGTSRAAWLTSNANDLAANGAQIVLLLDYPGVGGAAEPLQDSAEIDAWASIMAGGGGSVPPPPTDDHPVVLDLYTGASLATLLDLDSNVGAASALLTGGVSYYLRLYPVTETDLRTDIPLRWSLLPRDSGPSPDPDPGSGGYHVAASLQDITISVPDYLVVDVGNGSPGETVDFYLDDDLSDSLLTDTLDDSGSATGIHVPIPASTTVGGAHILHVVTAVNQVDLAFTVLAQDNTDDGEPEDPPDDPDKPETLPNRWVIHDPAMELVFSFEVNPDTVSSPYFERSFTVKTSTAPDGQALVWEGAEKAPQWTFSGKILDPAQLNALADIQAENRRVHVYDHLDRRFVVTIETLDATPVRDIERKYTHNFSVTAFVCWQHGMDSPYPAYPAP